MDKTSERICPKCHAATLDVFYSEKGDDPQAAKCTNCEFTGMFVGNKLIELIPA